MYTITKTEYGLHIVFDGSYSKSEIECYIAEKEKLISTFDGPFSMLIDARTAFPAEEDDLTRLKESQEKIVGGRLQRMAVIVNSPVIMRQARQIGFMSGSSEFTRFINASKTSEWEKLSIDWVSNGIEPRLETAPADSSSA